MTTWIGVTLGDVTGIGPEVALKALAAETSSDGTRYLLIGDENIARRLNEKIQLPLKKFSGYGGAGKIFVANPLAEPLPENLPAGSPVSANAAVTFLRDGAERCMRRELDAIVTAPVNKESIIRAGYKFVGQTEFLSTLAGAKRTAMMLLGQDDRGHWLRVALVTTHVALKDIAKKITQPNVELAIELAVQSCHDLQLPRARIAVLRYAGERYW